MKPNQVLLYSIEIFTIIIVIYYISLYQSFRFLNKVQLCYLFIFNSIVCLFNAYISGKDGDIFHYYNDSKVLYYFLDQNFFKYYQVLFKNGGGFIPRILAEPLFEIGHWGNPSMYFMVKAFTWSSLFSSSNIYNISLFFSLSSFTAKYFSLRILELFKIEKTGFYIAIFILFFSGLDSFFITGMYKENFIFLFLIYIIYYFLSQKTYVKTAVFLLFLYYLFYLKPHLVGVIYLGVLIYCIYKLYTYKQFFYNLIISFLVGFHLIMIKKFHIIEYIITKKTQFNSLKGGTTNKEVINFSDSAIDSILVFFKSILSIFISPLDIISLNFKSIIINYSNFSFIFIFLFLIRRLYFYNKFIFYYLVIIGIISLFFIGFIVPNYGAQLRYRSVYMIILIITLLQFNIRKINI